MDCRCDCWDEYFVIRHELWAQVVGEPRAGFICVECLERRLGRELLPDDFLPCPANDPTWRKTPRLRARLGEDIGLRTLTKRVGEST